MSKIFGFYAKNDDGIDIDKAWFDSSNVKYAECLDNDNELKTLKVVFNNGGTYQYNKVKVQDYLLFREDVSQGKAINKYIKANKYEYVKLEDTDLDKLTDELTDRREGYLFVTFDNGVLKVKNNVDTILYEKSGLSDETVSVVCDILVSTGNKVKLNGVKHEKQ